MTLSIRTTLRSLSLLVLTAGFMPGCDNEEYEALELSSEEIDAMSEEELDELALLEEQDGDLGHSVSHKGFAMPIHHSHPQPTDGAHDLARAPSASPSSLDPSQALSDPTRTHTGGSSTDTADKHGPGDVNTLPTPTHVPNTIGELDEIRMVGVDDPGCRPYVETQVLAARN